MRPEKAAFLTKAHGKPKAAPGAVCHPKGRSKAEDGAAVDRSRQAWPLALSVQNPFGTRNCFLSPSCEKSGAPGSISTQRRLRPSLSWHVEVWKRTPLASVPAPFSPFRPPWRRPFARAPEARTALAWRSRFQSLPADQDGAAEPRQHKRAQRRGADDRQRPPGKPRLSLCQNKLRPVERIQACSHRFLWGLVTACAAAPITEAAPCNAARTSGASRFSARKACGPSCATCPAKASICAANRCS